MCYPHDRLHEEIAFLGYYLHWSYESLLSMEHHERQKWIEKTSAINQKVNEGSTPAPAEKSILSIT
ncbi:DUF6760 family protein [Celerinatantimonas diazotrophica]|uniref:DUF6760 family protein n=1 Tax=Celerinatantimonas diazotrophica TaxID=412034 RepID=UPI002D76A039|nr:DUF6760 family protein [Celerinatantimonas diazotrophica]